MSHENFVKFEDGFFVDKAYAESFRKMSLTSINAVFEFQGDENLSKSNLAKHRSRIRFQLPQLNKTLFLKRYNRVPILTQIKNWVSHLRRASTSDFDRMPTEELKPAGIAAPKTVAFGEQWGKVFEKRSFIFMEKVENGISLEEKLPDCFCTRPISRHKERCEFINTLADFTKRFHETGFRHRDYYLCHIFLVDSKDFCLIDMQRSFKPFVFSERYRLKDITQLHYSAPGDCISQADRLRFYLRYSGKPKLDISDRKFLGKVKSKAWRIAVHDIKHGREVPFAR